MKRVPIGEHDSLHRDLIREWGFTNIQSMTLFALGLHNDLYVGMGLVRVQHQGVSVNRAKLLPRKVTDRILRRRP